MKIAILTDVAGNLPALQVALRAIRQEGADAIFHTGDAIGIGPFPAEDLVGRARYVHPGSLGCHAEPIARFAILECESRSYELKMRHVPYDDSALFQQFERRDVPDRHFIYKAFFGGRNY